MKPLLSQNNERNKHVVVAKMAGRQAGRSRSISSRLGIVVHNTGLQEPPEIKGVCHEQGGQGRRSTTGDRRSNGVKVLVPSTCTGAGHTVNRAWESVFLKVIRHLVEIQVGVPFERSNGVMDGVVVNHNHRKPQIMLGERFTNNITSSA